MQKKAQHFESKDPQTKKTHLQRKFQVGAITLMALSCGGFYAHAGEKNPKPLVVVSDNNDSIDLNDINPAIYRHRKEHEEDEISDLKHQLNEKEALIGEFRRQIQKMQGETLSQEELLTQMESEIDHLSVGSNPMQDVDANFKAMQRALSGKNRKINQLEDELAKYNQYLAEKSRQLESQGKIYADHQQKLHDQLMQVVSALELEKSHTKELNQSLKDLRKKKRDTQSHSLDLERELMQSAHKIASLQTQQFELQQLLNEKEREFRKEFERQTNLQSRLEQKTRQLAKEIEVKNVQLQKIRAEAKTTQASLSKQIVALSQERAAPAKAPHTSYNKKDQQMTHRLQKQVGCLAAGYEFERSNANRLQQQLRDSRQQNSNERNIRNEKPSQMYVLENDLRELKDQLEEKDKEIADLKEKLAAVADLYQMTQLNLQNRKSALTDDEVKELRLELSRKNESLQQITQEFESLVMQLEKNDSDLANKEQATQSIQRQLLEQIELLTKNYEQERNEREKAESVLNHMSEHQYSDQEELARIKGQLELREAEIQRRQSDLEALESELDLMKTAMSEEPEHDGSHAESIALARELENRVQQLQEELSHKQGELESKENFHSGMQRQLMSQLELLTQNYESEKLRAEELNRSLSSLEQEMQDLRSQQTIAGNDSHPSAHEKQLEQLREELSKKNAELDHKEAFHSNIQDHLTEQLEQLSHKYDWEKKRADELSQSLESHENEMNSLKNSLHGRSPAPEDHSLHYEQQLEQLRNELAARSSELESKETFHDNIHQQMVDQLHEISHNYHTEKKLRQELNETIDRMERELQNKQHLENNLNDHETRVAALDSEIKVLQHALEQRERENRELQAELQQVIADSESKHHEEHSSLQDELKTLRESVKQGEKQNKALQEDLQKLSDSLDSKQRELHNKETDYTTQNDQLTQQVNELTRRIQEERQISAQLQKSLENALNSHHLATSNSEHLEHKLGEQSTRIEDLQNQLAEYNKLLQSRQNDLNELQHKQQSNDKSGKINALEDQLAEYNRILHDRQNEILKLEQQLQSEPENANMEAYEDLQEENRAMRSELENLKREKEQFLSQKNTPTTQKTSKKNRSKLLLQKK